MPDVVVMTIHPRLLGIRSLGPSAGNVLYAVVGCDGGVIHRGRVAKFPTPDSSSTL